MKQHDNPEKPEQVEKEVPEKKRPEGNEIHYTRAFFCFLLRLSVILGALALLLLPLFFIFSSTLRGREF